jgi:beta-xylosidase
MAVPVSESIAAATASVPQAAVEPVPTIAATPSAPSTPASATVTADAKHAARLPWGDQGDGTYRNPVLFADFSDPDVIRVGHDFYLIASDFHFVGMQVLHSRDLVNWSYIGQVFDRLEMGAKYDEMKGYAEGTWAPSLRFHKGTYYIYVCTPHDGLFSWTAKNPAGPWSKTITVKAVDAWEDPCPFWDDDGTAYLVHSRKGAGPLILHKLSDDGTRLLDDGVEIYRGPVAEGPKMFKRHGWYYISLPEGGVEKGGQTILRSSEIYGPYERRQVLRDGSPHQGGIVDLESGESWFIGFKSTGSFGRVSHLIPVSWGDDDWPVFGNEGVTVASAKKPNVGGGGPGAAAASTAQELPRHSDDFSGGELGPQWQWNHNPVADAWSLGARPGWLRLRGLPAAELTLARNTLTQKIWGPAGEVTVKLDTSGLSDGQRAGFGFMSGKVFAPIGVLKTGTQATLYWGDTTGRVLEQGVLWLRGSYDGDEARLSYSLDGVRFVDAPERVTLKFGQWKGARVTLFAYGPGGGNADFDTFNYALSPSARP